MLKEIRSLRIFAKEHHQVSIVKTQKRHLGIILTLIAVLLLAFYTIIFKKEYSDQKMSRVISAAFVDFFFLHLFMTLVFFIFCIANGKKYLKPEKPKLIVWRSIFAILSFCFYSLSVIWSKKLDNSILYGTDAFWVALLLYPLGIKIDKIALSGIFIGLAGIIFVYFFDINSLYDFIGGIMGTLSGFTLAVVVIMSSYMVKNDPPLRICLYNALIGCIVSGIFSLFYGFTIGWLSLTINDIVISIFSGLLFSLILFCFLEAYFYTESYIIASISYFLPVFIVVINWIILQKALPITTIVGSFIIVLGSLTVISSSFLKEKRKKLKYYVDSSISKK
ncbi:MAG: hypothetical protein AMS24_02690 [Chlamydiae bacterium SM23_39]|nr:MAG: hypothetical protein AMS24_02690 [Chlamydiae bacterium SM23_39]